MAETKQYKLVYEKEGELKGSYSGIPANDDNDVIKRTVLEGKEEPTPEPVDPTNFAHKVVPCDLGTIEKVDPTHPSFAGMLALVDVDSELLRAIIDYTWHAEVGEREYNLAFRVNYEGKEYIITSCTTDPEEEPEEKLKLINIVAIYANDFEANEQNIFESIEIVTDAETGDTLPIVTLKEVE